MTLSIPTRPSSHLGVGHRPCGGERSGCSAMTSSSKIRSRAAAHPRALARSPAGTDPPLVTEQATPRPVPLHRSLALQVPLLLVVALALAVAVGAWSLRDRTSTRLTSSH